MKNKKAFRKDFIRVLFVTSGREIAMERGLTLGLTAGTLRTWFSRWRGVLR
jgi:hypothetical protein